MPNLLNITQFQAKIRTLFNIKVDESVKNDVNTKLQEFFTKVQGNDKDNTTVDEKEFNNACTLVRKEYEVLLSKQKPDFGIVGTPTLENGEFTDEGYSYIKNSLKTLNINIDEDMLIFLADKYLYQINDNEKENSIDLVINKLVISCCPPEELIDAMDAYLKAENSEREYAKNHDYKDDVNDKEWNNLIDKRDELCDSYLVIAKHFGFEQGDKILLNGAFVTI